MVRRAHYWLTVVLLSCLTHLVAGNEPTGNWPQWRGPNRDNISTDTDLLQSWPKGGPPLRWRVEGIGDGIAAVAVAKGRIYTVGYIGEHEYVTALDERSGVRLWTTVIGAVVDEHPSMRWLAQRTPTVDE